MSLILSGTDGLSDVDGTAATPAIRGTDTNTGLFFPAADTVAASVGGTEGLRLTTTGLGVGRTPSAKLDVEGAGIVRGFLTTTDAIKLGGNTSAPSSTDSFIYRPADNTLAFGTASAERLRLDSSGNLGLGVTPSAWASGWKAVETQGGSLVAPTSGFIDVVQNAYYDGAWKYKNTAAASIYYQNAGAHYWTTAPSGTAGNAISFTQAMTLDASGNLGVGTTSPAKRFHVFSSTSAEVAMLESTVLSSDNVQLRFKGFSGERWAIGNNVATGGTGVNFDFYDLAASANRVRITSDGNLLVGTTSTPSSSNKGFGVLSNGAAGKYIANGVSITSNCSHVEFYNPNGVVGSIQTNGSTTSYNTSSDYRLKENIQPMTGALAKVAALKPCTYTWKADGSAGEGFIAHELQEICPSAVTGEKDAVNEDGSIKPQGIDTSFLVATLTAAIQEQQAIIESLTARITALEAK